MNKTTKVRPVLRELELADLSNDSNLLKNSQVLNGRFTKYLLFSIFIASFGSSFQFGWSTGIYVVPVNTIQNFFREIYLERNGIEISNSTLNAYWSITNGLIPLGAIFGGLSSGAAADYFGRKTSLFLVNTFVIISVILNLISKYIRSYETLMIGRFFTGIYCGLFSGILPLYLSECPPKNLRGLIGVSNQLFLVFGTLFTKILGLPELLGSRDLWPILVSLGFIPVLVHIGIFYAPESPKHLFINLNQRHEAEEVLKKLRNNQINLVRKELDELNAEKERLSQVKLVEWKDLFLNQTLKRALIVTLGIQISQQFSGINAVLFYSTQIFQSAGLQGSWPVYGTILITVVQIIVTIGYMLTIDKVGRRLPLLIGFIGTSLFSFMIAITRIFGENVVWLNYLTVVSAILYMISYKIGPGPIPWLITSELFRSDSRGKATSIAVFTNWFSNFIITVSFPFIESSIGSYSFLIYGVLSIFFSLFVLFFVPETKNRPVEEIVEMFEKKILFFPNK